MTLEKAITVWRAVMVEDLPERLCVNCGDKTITGINWIGYSHFRMLNYGRSNEK